MLKRTRERIHTIKTGGRCAIAFTVGAVLFMLFYAALRGIYKIPGLRLDLSTHGLVEIYPVLLCFIACLLDEDLLPTVAACIGASAALVVPFSRDGYVSNAVTIAIVFAFHGVCFYFGRKPGWKAAIVRAVSLFPTFALTISFFVIEFREGVSVIDSIISFLLLILGIICYYLIGRKKARTTRDVIIELIIIILTAFVFLIPTMYLYPKFIPYYYP